MNLGDDDTLERIRIGAFNAEQYARFKAECYFMCIPTRGPRPWVDPIPFGSRDER